VAPSEYFDRYPLSKIRLTKNPAGDLDDIPAIVARTLGATAGNMKMNEDSIFSSKDEPKGMRW
jgi:hypothetical protein